MFEFLFGCWLLSGNNKPKYEQRYFKSQRKENLQMMELEKK